MSKKERQELGLNGREYAKREFGRAKLMDRLDELLGEAVRIRNLKDR
jgi:hypothetical protein